jgi:hypothetical protein
VLNKIGVIKPVAEIIESYLWSGRFFFTVDEKDIEDEISRMEGESPLLTDLNIPLTP